MSSNQEKDNIKVLEDCIKETQRFFLNNNKKQLYREILETVERALIEIILQKADGNKKKAAKLLSINRNTLHAKIKKLKIDVSKFKFYY